MCTRRLQKRTSDGALRRTCCSRRRLRRRIGGSHGRSRPRGALARRAHLKYRPFVRTGSAARLLGDRRLNGLWRSTRPRRESGHGRHGFFGRTQLENCTGTGGRPDGCTRRRHALWFYTPHTRAALHANGHVCRVFSLARRAAHEPKDLLQKSIRSTLGPCSYHVSALCTLIVAIFRPQNVFSCAKVGAVVRAEPTSLQVHTVQRKEPIILPFLYAVRVAPRGPQRPPRL